MALPTYVQALALVQGLTTGSPWPNILKIIPKYLDGPSLASSSRVSKEWNKAINKYLWADPLKIVGHELLPSSRTIKFIKAALLARDVTRGNVLQVDFGSLWTARSLTQANLMNWHQMDHIITGELALEWLVLFHGLRFMMLDRLMGFGDFTDSGWCLDAEGNLMNPHNCRLTLFSASHCKDFYAPKALGVETRVLPSMKNLLYLDLSYTSSDEAWYSRIGHLLLDMHDLRSLVIRGLRLTDIAVKVILDCVSPKLFSLDLRDNLITDKAISDIASILIPSIAPPYSRIRHAASGSVESFYEDLPAYTRGNEVVVDDYAVPLRHDTRYDFVKYLLARDQVLDSHDPFLKVIGLTNLDLANNKFTGHGIRTLLEYPNRLQALDVGSVRLGPVTPGTRLKLDQPTHKVLFQGPTTSLFRTQNSRLEMLRVHHSVVTCTPTLIPSTPEDKTYSPELISLAENAGQRWGADLYVPYVPTDNNRLHTLVLTGIPSKTTGFVLQKLIQFLRECAAQERTINDIRAGVSKHRLAPVILSGLREIMFEFLSEPTTAPAASSVSGDQDADNFLSESMKDFSFFEDSQPPPPPPRPTRRQTLEKSLKPPQPVLLDTVDALNKYLAASEFTEGSWTGKVRINTSPYYA